MLTPMLTVVTSGRPSTMTGALNASLMREAVSLTCCGLFTFLSTTMNSSPPIRTTTSSSRTVDSHAGGDGLQQLVAGSRVRANR